MNEVDPAILNKMQGIILKYDTTSEQICQGMQIHNGEKDVVIWTQRLAIVFARPMYGGNVVDFLLNNANQNFTCELTVKHGHESPKS